MTPLISVEKPVSKGKRWMREKKKKRDGGEVLGVGSSPVAKTWGRRNNS